MDKKENKKAIKEDFLKTIVDLEEHAELERILKKNEIIFRIGDKTYRVRKPNYEEQLDIEKFRRKKYLDFFSDDTMLTRKQWMEKYKTKGIDLLKMDEDIIKLQNEIEALMLRLAKTTNEQDIKKLKEEILKLRNKQVDINIEKTDFLSYSIEDQLMIAVNSYFTYMVLEIKEVDNWKRMFANYKEFSQSNNTALISKAFYYINYLIYDLPVEEEN